MIERSANLLLDRGLVVLGATDLDITQTVIGRLNTALPKVTVTPVAPKAGARQAGRREAAGIEAARRISRGATRALEFPAFQADRGPGKQGPVLSLL